MRYSVAIANTFTQKVDLCVVDAPDPLNACRGILFDLLQNEGATIAGLKDFESISDFANEYDVLISKPVAIDSIHIVRPDPSDFFADSDGIDATLDDSDFRIDETNP